jgi:heme oxygenase
LLNAIPDLVADPRMILARLEQETRAFHPEVEKPWLQLVAAGRRPTRDDYIALLIKTYGFESPLEAALAYTPHLSSLIEAHRRFRSGLIAQDLLKLGISPQRLTELPQRMIAPFSTVAEAMGWLYVHERATTIHDRVRRELAWRLPIVGEASSYLGACQGIANVLWDDFARALASFAQGEDSEQRIIAAATDGFRTAATWYGSGGADRESRRSSAALDQPNKSAIIIDE